MPYDSATPDFSFETAETARPARTQNNNLLDAMKTAGKSLVSFVKRKGVVPAMIAAAAALTAPHARAQSSNQVQVTITGSVSSGTDGYMGNALAFNTGSTNLATQPFTLTFYFDPSKGTDGSDLCSDGYYDQSYVSGSGSSNGGTAVLQVGSNGGQFSIGGQVGESSVTTNANMYAPHCGGSSRANYGATAYYDAAYGGSGSGANFGGDNIIPATGVTLENNADWTAAISPKTLDSTHLISFSIDVSVAGSLWKYASGYLAPTSITVVNNSLDQNAEENGAICPTQNAATPSDQWGGMSTPVPLGAVVTGQTCVADPINVSTGNVFERATDYAAAGPNPLTFERYYNSMGSNVHVLGNFYTTNASSLGANWRTNYDRYLETLTGGMVAERPDGKTLRFTLQGSTWTPNGDVDYTLTQSGSTWTLKGPDDTVETYTMSGSTAAMQSIQQRNGYTQTLSYSGGKLSTVTDSYGRTLNMSYSGSLLQSVSTPDSTSISFGYSTSGGSNVLTSVTYPTGTLSYQYGNSSFPLALTAVIDENSNTLSTWAYDSQGRATSNQRGGSLAADQTTVAYNSGGTVTVTNALGVADTYIFTTLQGIPKVTEISRAATSTTAAATRYFGYDANGYLGTATDWNGNTTNYTNNSHGQPTTIVEADGNSVSRTTATVYDTTFPHLPDSITTAGLTTSYTYDGSGNPLTKTDTDTTTTSTPYSTNGQTRETQWTWSSTGQMLSIQLPRTDVTAKTAYTYDSSGALTEITDALSHNTQITSHTGGGRPLTVVDPNSVTTTMTYDGRQNLLTSTLHTGAGNLTTTWTFDAAQNLTALQQPDGSKLTYGYDNAHRLTSVTDLIGNSITYTLDALGDRTATTWKNPSSTTTKSTSATFDALGRMLTNVGGMSQTTTLTYDKNGNAATVKDPMSNTVTNTWDALNRLSKVQDPSPGGATTYTYDAHDRVLSVKDPNSHTTSYVYDGFGDRIQIASPDAGTSTYYFDKDRNTTQLNLPGSMTASVTYDALDRWLTTSYPSDNTLNVSNTYDQTTGHGFGVGRLTSATDKPGSLSLTYDERGNVTSESRTITSAGTLNTTTGYDAASNIFSITYPSGTVVDYTRDSMGKITAVTAKPNGASSFSNVATSITYEPFGPVTGVNFGNGFTGTYAFDNDYRPTTRVDGATSNVLSLSYGYNANDNVTGITDSVNSANTQTLGYDALNRLTSATSGTGGYGTWSWTWDAGSNVSTQKINGTTTTFSLTSGSNKLSQWVTGSTTETVTNTSPGNINLLKIGSTTEETLTYNQANQLASAQTTSSFASYAFDLTGQRLEKSPSGSYPILYHYGRAAGELLSENDLHSGQTADYIYLNGRPIGEANPTTGALYFMHTDRLGTVDTVTDSSKNVVWNALYQPFGSNGIGGITGTLGTQSLRLPGQYFDPETSYNHNGFRDYAGAITRYVEADPIGIGTVAGKQPNDINTFQYVNGNAFKFIDTNGTTSDPWWWTPVHWITNHFVIGPTMDKTDSQLGQTAANTFWNTYGVPLMGDSPYSPVIVGTLTYTACLFGGNPTDCAAAGQQATNQEIARRMSGMCTPTSGPAAVCTSTDNMCLAIPQP